MRISQYVYDYILFAGNIICHVLSVVDVVFKQVYKYLDANNILIANQYGFRPNYSTALALFELTENIRKAIDTGHVVALVTKDYQ